MNPCPVNILVAFLFLSTHILSQSDINIEKITAEDGLVFRATNHLYQDQQGYIWITTPKGLNRYDGYEFRLFQHSEQDTSSIPSNDLWAIMGSKDGTIWIRASGYDTYMLDPSTERFHKAKLGENFFKSADIDIQTLPKEFLPYLPEMANVLQAPREGLDHSSEIDEMTEAVMNTNMFSDNLPMVTKHGTEALWIWFCQSSNYNPPKLPGVHYAKFDIKNKRWEKYSIDQILSIRLAHAYLPIDLDGRYWFPLTHSDSIQLFDSFLLPDGLPLNSWEILRVDNKQNIWLLNTDRSLFRYELQSKKLEKISIVETNRFDVFEDSEGTIWITSENGIQKIKKKKQLFTNYLHQTFNLGEVPPIGKSMRYLVEAGNGLVFAFQPPSALFQINPTTHSINLVNLNYPLSRLTAQDGENFWISFREYGLGRYNTSKAKIEYFAYPTITASEKNLIDPSPKMWLRRYGNERNLFYFDLQNNTPFHIDKFPGYNFEHSFWHRTQNLLWTNHEKGIAKIDLRDLSTEYFELFEKIQFGFVRGWLPDGNQLWLATVEGLKLFDLKTKSITQNYTKEHGLPHSTIYSVVRSDENLWLGTHNGLSCFNPKTLDVKNFFVEDGLSHNEFNTNSLLQASDGQIWMGGLNGINVFDPKELENIVVDSAELRLTKFSKFSHSQDSLIIIEKEATLKHTIFCINPNDQYFNFHFALMSLVAPTKNRYSWYLEGYESPWVHAGSTPIANYQNIPPGHYTLKVKAIDYRGVPATNTLSIPLKVLRVWYQRWWAWLLYGFILGGGAYFFYRFQLKRKLNQQERLRLQELNAVKTKLYTNITHEFRTPLTVILGVSQQLIQKYQAWKTEKPKDYNWMNLIQRNGQNLLQLVNQMLDLAKLEVGEMSLKLIHGDVIVHLKYLLESFHSLANPKGIRLHFLSELQALEMAYDPDRLQNIVSNLLSNAIKFTPEGGDVYVFISNSASTNLLPLEGFENLQGVKDLEALEIKIKDTGIGIAEEKLPHIFDRFYQADDSTTRKGEGTGIGLALVKELVKLMQGRIEVESTLGQGTVFKLLLPVRIEKREEGKERRSTVDGGRWTEIAQPAFDDQHLVSSDQHPMSNIQTTINNEQSTNNEQRTTNNNQRITNNDSTNQPVNQSTLLIIEDHLDVAQYIQSCLENKFQITHALDGQEGIDRALELIPDVIISDIMMPEKDGFEVVQTLKNDERTSHIPIILLTAKAGVDAKIAGLERGADAYLAKPFNQRELQVRLQKLIELRQHLQARYATLTSLPPTPEKAFQLEDQFVLKIQEIMENNLSDPDFGVPQLCRKMGKSRSQIFRKLKALTGKSIALYIRFIRLQKAKELLQSTNLTVAEVAYEVGFKDPAYFSRTFLEEFGEQPHTTRK